MVSDVDGIATLNPFRYRSYYFDEETGLYYLQTRYYDPELGRFISADSIEYLDPETSRFTNKLKEFGKFAELFSAICIFDL